MPAERKVWESPVGYYFKVFDDLRLVYKKVWGEYGDAESKASHEEWDVLNTQGEVGDYDELQDLSEVTSYGVSIDQIRRLASHYEKRWNEEEHEAKKLAYVAPSPLAFGTGRVYSALIDTTAINFRVFEDMSGAVDWLGLDEATRERVVEHREEKGG